MPSGKRINRRDLSQKTFYRDQLNLVNNFSQEQEKAIELAPELAQIYQRQMKQKMEKYELDWDMAEKDREYFEPYSKTEQFVSRQPTLVRPNSRSKSLLYKKAQGAKSPTNNNQFQMNQEIQNLKQLRRSRFFNDTGGGSQLSKGSYFLQQNRMVKHGKFKTSYIPQKRQVYNIQNYCKLANKSGYTKKQDVSQSMQLPA